MEESVSFWAVSRASEANRRTLCRAFLQHCHYHYISSTAPRKRLPLSNTSRRYRRSGALGCQTWPFKTYALKHATPLRGVSFAESPNASDPYWTLGRAKMPSLNMSVSSQLAALASRSPRSSKLQSAMKLRMTRFRNGQQTRMGSFQDAVLFLRSCNLSRVSRDFRFNCCMLHVPNKDH
jgi:hypothetical protein